MFGRFEAVLDGTPLTDFKTAKVRALLAYVAVEADSPHERASLAGLFWPEMPGNAALRNLTQTVLRVRNVIHNDDVDPPYLLVTRQAVKFNTESSYAIDTQRFESAIKKNALNGTAPPASANEAITQLEDVLDLYRGEFLVGISLPDCEAFSEWLEIKRDRYHQMALDGLGTVAALHLQSGNYGQAIQYAQRQLELDLWQERAYRQLMQALAMSGQRAAALTQYARCCEILRDELNVDPEPATVELFEQIKAGAVSTNGHELPASTASTNGLAIGISATFAATQSTTSTTPPVPETTCVIPHNVHRQRTSIIGREQLRQEIMDGLAEPACRLITLAGPGGVGKTRLALAAAEQFVNELTAADAPSTNAQFMDGVWLVALAGVGQQPTTADVFVPVATEPATTMSAVAKSHVAQAILDALGQELSGAQVPQDRVLNLLRTKNLLLVLDNFEHVIDEADLLPAILREAPNVRIIVTSRELLNISGERVIRLDGLAIPKSANTPDAANYDSVRLFVERVKATFSQFELDEEQLTYIIDICRLLDGTPLGIELAAAWVQHFSCAEIAESLQSNADFLASTRRDSPERHQSLRAAFNYSWHLLAESEQRTLAQLVVFRGSFSRAAAQAVTDASLIDLAALVDKSLLRQTAPGRYTSHEQLRQFALEQLQKMSLPAALRGDDAQLDYRMHTQQRHAAYYLRYVGESAPLLYGSNPKKTLDAIKREMENVRHAWQWAIANQQLVEINQHISALCTIFKLQGMWPELEGFLRQLTTLLTEDASGATLTSNWPQLLPKVLVERARSLTCLFRYDEAIAVGQHAIAASKQAGDTDSAAGGCLYLGATYSFLNEHENAKPLLEESVQLFESIPLYHAPTPGRGVASARAIAHYVLAAVHLRLGEEADAQEHERVALRIFQQAKDPWGRGRALTYLGHAHYWAGNYDQAIANWEEALTIFSEVDSPSNEGEVRNQLRLALATVGQYEIAQEHGEHALAIARQVEKRVFEFPMSESLSRLMNRIGL